MRQPLPLARLRHASAGQGGSGWQRPILPRRMGRRHQQQTEPGRCCGCRSRLFRHLLRPQQLPPLRLTPARGCLPLGTARCRGGRRLRGSPETTRPRRCGVLASATDQVTARRCPRRAIHPETQGSPCGDGGFDAAGDLVLGLAAGPSRADRGADRTGAVGGAAEVGQGAAGVAAAGEPLGPAERTVTSWVCSPELRRVGG